MSLSGNPSNHAICVPCWNLLNPKTAVDPARCQAGALEQCCYCDAPTLSGIYIRGEPAETPCKGRHPH